MKFFSFVLSFLRYYYFNSGNDLIMTILRERCDGNRNLLHACVSMCAPVSNKDHEAGKFDFFEVKFSYSWLTTESVGDRCTRYQRSSSLLLLLGVHKFRFDHENFTFLLFC